MPIATGLAIGLGAASIAGGVASSALGAHAAGKAADAQTAAAQQAAQLQHQDAQAALQFQQQVYGNQQQEIAPYLQTGYGGLANLGYLLGITPQSAQQAPSQAQLNSGCRTARAQFLALYHLYRSARRMRALLKAHLLPPQGS
jgi:hypothetical protein